MEVKLFVHCSIWVINLDRRYDTPVADKFSRIGNWSGIKFGDTYPSDGE